MSDARFTGLHEHPKELRYGRARLIYVEGFGRTPSAWWLPGGTYTTNEMDAMSAAIEIDRVLREHEQ